MDNKYECLRLKNQICFPLYLCSKEIIRRYTPYLNKVNLTYTQYIVMMYFWEKKTSNVKELGNVLWLDSSTLTPLLKKLEDKGYIKRDRSLVDERNLIVTITAEGEKLKDSVLEVPAKVGSCLNLSEKEVIDLYNLMGKILMNVKENENENS